jgi:hypothetical protein
VLSLFHGESLGAMAKFFNRQLKLKL